MPHELFSFKSPFDKIEKISISPDNLVVAAVRQNSLSLFGLAHRGQNFTFEKVFNSPIHQVEFDPVSNFVAVTGDKYSNICKFKKISLPIGWYEYSKITWVGWLV